MFFDGERARIEAETKELDVWDIQSPSLANGEGEQLGDYLQKQPVYQETAKAKIWSTYATNYYGRVTEEKKLVDTRNDDGPHKPYDNVSTDRQGGNKVK